MQLVNEGLLDLDRPVRDVLPDFRLADEQAAQVVTPRQLLCHTGGFEGDHYVRAPAPAGRHDLPQLRRAARGLPSRLTAPGELFAYSNAGYVVLGRIVEVLRGRPFDVVLRERLARTARPGDGRGRHYDEYPRCAVADGYLPVAGVPRPVEKPMPGSDSPAGSAFAMSARDAARLRPHAPGDDQSYDAMRRSPGPAQSTDRWPASRTRLGRPAAPQRRHDGGSPRRRHRPFQSDLRRRAGGRGRGHDADERRERIVADLARWSAMCWANWRGCRR